ncbi:MAG: ABC transporter permease, partial [Thermoanaerobaculia bacterium]|nr:ABC transporter permease [Thermoanaerobaculia bacterium]
MRTIRYALRRLLAKPGFTATAVLSLAVGVGANAAIFSLVNALLIRDVPLADPERLVNVYLSTPDFEYGTLSHPDYDDLVAGSEAVFEGVATSQMVIGQTEVDGVPSTVLGEAVSGNYFEVLGVEAALGRALGPSDAVAPGAHPVVVLSHGQWQKQFGGDPEVVGQSLRLAGRPFEIVGVAPESYPGNTRGVSPAFYASRMMIDVIQGSSRSDLENRGNHSNMVKARLRPGVSIAEAQGVVDGIAAHLREQEIDDWDPEGGFALIPTREVLFFPAYDRWLRATAWMLSAVVGLVLLLACTNLAGFLLAQAVDRKKEISLRLALGATRADLVAQLLAESLLLASVGGAIGVATAAALLRVPVEIEILVPVGLDLSLDATVLAYSLAITLLAGLALGLAPALQSSRPDVASTLKEEGAGGGQPGKLRLRNVLIGTQVAISTVLLVAAGLFLRSFEKTLAADPGFGRDPAAVIGLLVPATRFDEPQARRYLETLLDRFEAHPGVEDVGLTSRLHLTAFSTSNGEYNVDGFDPPPGREGHGADRTIVDPGFFAAAGVRIVRGRNFDEHDLPDSTPVAIVSEVLADRFFPGADPTGRYLRGVDGDDDLMIVGVASDAKVRSLGEEPRSFVYYPLSQRYTGFLTVVARTSRNPDVLAAELLAIAKDHDPDFWAIRVTTMERHIGTMTLPARLNAVLLTIFAGIAVSLAAIGLYGIVSYAVSQRTREIGIRRSLGAEGGEVVRMLMATGMRPVALGAAVGVALSLLVSRLLSSLLFAVEPLDA